MVWWRDRWRRDGVVVVVCVSVFSVEERGRGESVGEEGVVMEMGGMEMGGMEMGGLEMGGMGKSRGEEGGWEGRAGWAGLVGRGIFLVV